jgi:hypothetical protein
VLDYLEKTEMLVETKQKNREVVGNARRSVETTPSTSIRRQIKK